jgi:hypothetical protein
MNHPKAFSLRMVHQGTRQIFLLNRWISPPLSAFMVETYTPLPSSVRQSYRHERAAGYP